MKRLAILGSTGSIGRQTLEVVRALPDRLRVVGLAGGRNVDLLMKQIAEFKPRLVSLQSIPGQGEPSAMAQGLPSWDYDLLTLEEMASHPDVDLVVVATSGKAGLGPTLAAIDSGKRIALANKEVLVMAGEIVTARARQGGVDILPIDSEHSALWQCLHDEGDDAVGQGRVAGLILTASGGPFRDYTREQLASVTPEQALRHPTWQMGTKVTIDSATLMNKGMEAIEARWLFGVPLERIRVLIHPQSIVHSMVEFVDGSLKAQLSAPDMRLPIQYALSYPERWSNLELPRLDLDQPLSLDFRQPDLERFPCLGLALEAGRWGGTYPAAMAAADEVAVELFLEGKIGFLDIALVVEATLEQHRGIDRPSLEEILEADAEARDYTARAVSTPR